MAKATLDVEVFGRVAGVLRRKDNGNLQFRYDPDYIESKGPPLSINLPVRKEAYSHRNCLAFFGNLLPEEDVREQIALTTGISAANDYKLLERLGGDVAWAVTLRPPDKEDCKKTEGHLEELSPQRLDQVLTELPQRPLAADEEVLGPNSEQVSSEDREFGPVKRKKKADDGSRTRDLELGKLAPKPSFNRLTMRFACK